MGKLRELSRELGAEIIYYSEIENNFELEDEVKGLYIPEANVIYIRNDLTLFEQENVILHEIGHCYYEHCHYDCRSTMYDSKQEAQANRYMVEYRFKEWLSAWDFEPEPDEVDIFQFMCAYDFGDDIKWICEEVIEEYYEGVY